MTSSTDWGDLFDAGLFIGALLDSDPRHTEAFPLVDAARNGEIRVCTTTGILSEVYGALTWHLAVPPHSPAEAAQVIARLLEPPSAIQILPDSRDAALKTMEIASAHNLTARRIHDARHAAAALAAGVTTVYTYDVDDWKLFASEGLTLVGPASSLLRASGA